jgi:hypothetical protein
MKNNNIKISKWLAFGAVLTAALAILPRPANAFDNGIAILVQQSPADGGTVDPGEGVHKFESGSEVVLTAVPKPGYQFVHWIGDVADSTSGRTTAYLDSPKIIIAVFERSEFEFIVTEELSDIRPGGGMYRSAADYSNQGYSGGGGAGNGSRWGGSDFEPPPEPDDDIPTPDNDDTNDVPVPEPIPEPATILLLSLGCLGMVRKSRELTKMNL